ncbi:MAG: N-acetyltransferase [Acidobacteriota bacterium]|nr:N-acetyltransferase [Acidobacteriota bacterium]
MKINKKESDGKGKFFIEENGKQLALMTYKKSGADKIVIEHTEVDESLQGEGIGNDLVEAGVKFARENDLKIVATCPFAKKVIDETPEFQDVLSA